MRTFATHTRTKPRTPVRTPRRRVPVISRAPATTLQRAEIRQILHGPHLQAKLTVGAPDDAYEREADRVADAVMRMPEPDERIQRMCPECEEQMQRQPADELEEEEVLSAKSLPGETPEVGDGVESQIHSLRGGGQPLPEATRSFFEPRFGESFAGVRVHDDSRAQTLARAVNARAFTVGQDIVFGGGQLEPDTAQGKKLLAHELTHVVQQTGGRG